LSVTSSTHSPRSLLLSFFFNDTATTRIYTLSLHDALPIYGHAAERIARVVCDDECFDPNEGTAVPQAPRRAVAMPQPLAAHHSRSEEHTSELQSRGQLVCRLLLEKKKKPTIWTLRHTSRLT